MNTQNNTLDELLAELAGLDVQLSLDGDSLSIAAPRGAITADLQARLKSHKTEILARLAARSEAEINNTIVCDPKTRHEPFDLTDIQQAYWIGRTDLAEHGSVMCHYYQEFESEGLDLKRLEQAFCKVIARHDMLRAVIDSDGRQRILERVPEYQFGVSDVRGCREAVVHDAIKEVREAMAYEVFDASQWPLFNIHAVQMDSAKLRLHVSVDLIMIDAESLSKMIWEWRRFYDEPTLDSSPLDFSFRDYVLAEKSHRESNSYKQSLNYWQGRLEDLPGAPALPRPPAGLVECDNSVRVRSRKQLAADIWGPLKDEARDRGITGSGLLCAVFAEVLAAWSRESHFCINLTFCDRRPIHQDVEAQLGDFTTNVLLEADMKAASILERAKLLQDQLRKDLDHTQVSGVEVLRRLNRHRQQRSLVTMPVVFTSLLGHKDGAPNVLFSSNWLGEQVYGISQTPQVSLDFQAYEENGGLLLQWDSIAADYPDGVLDAMFSAYHGALEALSKNPSRWQAGDLVELPQAQADIRHEVNATAAEFKPELLHTPFERQAAIQPDAVAVIGHDRTLNYATLDRESLSLAHNLVSRNLQPGQHVAVVMEKGWQQVVAVLGILRAGAAYLPVDPALPDTRLQYLLKNGEAVVALTQAKFVNTLAWPSSVHVASIEPLPLDAPQPKPLQPRQKPGDLAYTIFTSGSTGQPKGVMIDHQGALNTVLDVNSRFAIGPQDRVLALSALNFDLSVYDIFGLLAAGGALVIPPEDARRDPGDWTKRVLEYDVTLWNTVPQLMRMLVEYHDGSDAMFFDSLRTVMMSGDWIPPSLPGRISRLLPNAAIYSLGGATEASIWSILHPISGPTDHLVSIPYGKAMANQSFHVLDPHLNPRPDWVEGELYIGGRGLALGYWRNEAETAHRFVVQPNTGERLYRTGDLGRALPDGNIEILGRVDFQVKIQGHRIELGEIEFVLKQHPVVHEAVVEAREDAAGQKHLVAFVVSHSEARNNPAFDPAALPQQLLTFVAGELPRYMVPSCVMPLQALPLSGNGKLDRKRLPEPDWHSGQASATHSSESSDAELTPKAQALLAAVESVLGQTGIALHDNVFDLGGNSVQMVQINRRLRDQLSLELPVAEMFNHATLASYASYLETAANAPVSNEKAKARGADQRAARARRRARAVTAE